MTNNEQFIETNNSDQPTRRNAESAVVFMHLEPYATKQQVIEEGISLIQNCPGWLDLGTGMRYFGGQGRNEQLKGLWELTKAACAGAVDESIVEHLLFVAEQVAAQKVGKQEREWVDHYLGLVFVAAGQGERSISLLRSKERFMALREGVNLLIKKGEIERARGIAQALGRSWPLGEAQLRVLTANAAYRKGLKDIASEDLQKLADCINKYLGGEIKTPQLLIEPLVHMTESKDLVPEIKQIIKDDLNLVVEIALTPSEHRYCPRDQQLSILACTAQAYANLGEVSIAEEMIGRLPREYTKYARISLADAYAEIGKIRNAIEVSKSFDDGRRVKFLLKIGHVREALRLSESMGSIFFSRDYKETVAKELAQRGKLEEALKVIENVKDEYHRSGYLHQRAQVFAHARHFPEAISEINKIPVNDPWDGRDMGRTLAILYRLMN